MIPNFTKVVDRLRGLVQHLAPKQAGPDPNVQLRMAAHHALVSAEQEAAVQCMLYLADHFTYYEQWREAVHLLAYCMPNVVIEDPRIINLVHETLAIAETMATPELEKAHVQTAGAQELAIEYFKNVGAMSIRGQYWMAATRIRGSQVAVEWGTGAGSNVIHAAQLVPSIRWIGIDLNEEQVDLNQQKAEEAKVDAEFYTPERFAVLGVQADSVGVLDTLEHSVHPGTILEEAESVLKPGGIVVLSIPNGPWSLHTENRDHVSVGNHVAVSNVGAVAQYMKERGRLLDIQLLGGPMPAEGNSCVAGVYQP